MISRSLVKLSNGDASETAPPTPLGEYGAPGEEWDLPPGMAPMTQPDNSVLRSDGGRISPQSMDYRIAMSNIVTNDDLGDLPTWLLIGTMCLLGLAIAVTAYLLPCGQHAALPPIRVY